VIGQLVQQRRGDATVLVAVEDRDRRFGAVGILTTAHVTSHADTRGAVVVDGERHNGASVGTVDVHQVVEESLGEVVGGIEESQSTRFG